jgi:hypothetical protein
VNNSVVVTLKTGSKLAGFFLLPSAAAVYGKTSVGSEAFLFKLFGLLTDVHNLKPLSGKVKIKI